MVTAEELEAKMAGRTVACVYRDTLGGVHLQFEDGGMADFNVEDENTVGVFVDRPAPPRPPVTADHIAPGHDLQAHTAKKRRDMADHIGRMVLLVVLAAATLATCY